MKYKFTRDAFIPKQATKVTDKRSDAVAYLYTRHGTPGAMVFFGKQARPILHYTYRTEERRNARVQEAFESRRKSLAYKAEQRSKRTSFMHSYKVGQLFHTSWGYEQTNVEYFEVIEIKGKYLILREVAQERVETGWLQGKCVPLPGQYLAPRFEGDDRGLPIRRLAQEGRIKIDDVRTAWSVKAELIGGVPVVNPSSWSAYH